MIEYAIMLGKWALTLLAVASIAMVFVKERRNFAFVPLIVRRFTFSMFAQCLLLVVATLTAGVVLIKFVPGMEYGWLHLFVPHGGNAMIAPVMDASKSDLQIARLLPPVFLLGLAVVMPFLTYAEERLFRSGYHDWASIRRQSVKFGLAHCIVGVPLGAGFALILPGLFFGCIYRRTFARDLNWLQHFDLEAADREATVTTTAYHTLYNLIIVSLLFVSATILLFAGAQ